MNEPRTAAEMFLAIFDAAEDRPDIRQLARVGLDRLAKLERENAELRRVLNEGLWDWPSGVLPQQKGER